MLQTNDKILFDLIQKEFNRQQTEIELIASENYVSKDVLEANGTILTNKYSEGYPGKRYYAGQEFIDEIENLAISRAKELFKAEYVNVQPLSGSPANMACYMAVLNPGDTVLGLSLDQGGHLSHGHPMNFSGLLYNMVPYFLDKETEIIDMDEVERIATETKPKMILAGFSAYPRNLDWKRFRQIADKVGAVLMADIAHIAGLVAGGVLENPIPYCDIVTTTTHKTLRGPRGAIIMSKEKYGPAIARAVFPGIQGGPHEHTIAAKAVAFKEALDPSFKVYVRQVVDNARHFAQNLMKNGFKIVSNGTDNHLILIDVFNSFGVTGQEAEKTLELVGLSTNKNMIPYDERKALDPSGIRIGTRALTTRGMCEKEIDIIGSVFYRSIKALQEAKGYNSKVDDKSNLEVFENKDFLDNLNILKQEVLKLCEKFPIYK
ncbi:serine hydroxymethyltransferase [Candidatus Gracilibacteria bacterium]|nr:serine hydroxymethyltransferase [Candidatus Gracilibacteria bacterium]